AGLIGLSGVEAIGVDKLDRVVGCDVGRGGAAGVVDLGRIDLSVGGVVVVGNCEVVVLGVGGLVDGPEAFLGRRSDDVIAGAGASGGVAKAHHLSGFGRDHEINRAVEASPA